MRQTPQFALALECDLVQSRINNQEYFVKTNNISAWKFSRASLFCTEENL
jgi:hypothetical protein